MAVEAVIVRPIEKPWGVPDLRRWGTRTQPGSLTGELRFERHTETSAKSALLVKVLLTSKDLSVQVHPDDAYARSIGLPHGKTEAWYILSADAGARVAVGLKTRLTQTELRSAIEDGSLAALLAWQSVAADDVILVPAGTIHTIGGGITLVEVQQNSDTTFRMSDPDHGRTLHIEHAVAAARAAPAAFQVRPEGLSSERTVLMSTIHFVVERIELPPTSRWCLSAEHATWLYGLSGSATAGRYPLSAGGGVFAQAAVVDLHVSAHGVACLVAYPGQNGPRANLLSRQRQ